MIGSARPFVIALALLTAGAFTALGEERPLPLHVEVFHPPVVARADQQRYLVHELHLTNFFTGAFDLESIEVFAASDTTHPVARFDGPRLIANLKHFPAPPDTAHDARLEAGRRVALLAWIPLTGTATPGTIRHRITVSIVGRPGSLTMLTPAVRVASGEPLVVGSPLRGGPWVAANAPRPDAVPGHNRLLFPRGGRMVMPQRFAVDWVRLGDDGRLWRGSIADNGSWSSYGQDVLAVAGGVVTAVKDSLPENTPPDVTTPMTQQSVAGNHVILDLGSGRWAVYGHLRPGSIRVRPGDRVKRGQVLAAVGNSGNSTGPHLHFHLIDGASTGAGEGIAFVYDRFESLGKLQGSLDDLEAGGAWKPAAAPAQPRRDDLPTFDSVVRFP